MVTLDGLEGYLNSESFAHLNQVSDPSVKYLLRAIAQLCLVAEISAPWNRQAAIEAIASESEAAARRRGPRAWSLGAPPRSSRGRHSADAE
eukprot:1588549-Prymnesium_polylepis.1